MPVALERKLKKEASKKGFTGEKKDAYVYGTLRKTGWKPDREKKMNTTSKLVRLSELNHNLGSVIEFAYDYEEPKTSRLAGAAALGVLPGAGIGGYLGHKAIQGSGGYGANWAAGRSAFSRGVRGTGLQGIAKGPGRSIGQGLGMALSKLKTILPSLKLNSKEKTIQFDEHILKPFSDGAVPNSKIIQEEFPADLSPAAVLKFPFPKLMRYLNRPNQLQQQYSGFSKREKLIELKAKVENLVHGS